MSKLLLPYTQFLNFPGLGSGVKVASDPEIG